MFLLRSAQIVVKKRRVGRWRTSAWRDATVPAYLSLVGGHRRSRAHRQGSEIIIGHPDSADESCEIVSIGAPSFSGPGGPAYGGSSQAIDSDRFIHDGILPCILNAVLVVPRFCSVTSQRIADSGDG